MARVEGARGSPVSAGRVNFSGVWKYGSEGGGVVGDRLETQLDWKNISSVTGEPCNAMPFKFGNCPTGRKWLRPT